METQKEVVSKKTKTKRPAIKTFRSTKQDKSHY